MSESTTSLSDENYEKLRETILAIDELPRFSDNFLIDTIRNLGESFKNAALKLQENLHLQDEARRLLFKEKYGEDPAEDGQFYLWAKEKLYYAGIPEKDLLNTYSEITAHHSEQNQIASSSEVPNDALKASLIAQKLGIKLRTSHETRNWNAYIALLDYRKPILDPPEFNRQAAALVPADIARDLYAAEDKLADLLTAGISNACRLIDQGRELCFSAARQDLHPSMRHLSLTNMEGISGIPKMIREEPEKTIFKTLTQMKALFQQPIDWAFESRFNSINIYGGNGKITYTTLAGLTGSSGSILLFPRSKFSPYVKPKASEIVPLFDQALAPINGLLRLYVFDGLSVDYSRSTCDRERISPEIWRRELEDFSSRRGLQGK